jgi:hypothetical protein
MDSSDNNLLLARQAVTASAPQPKLFFLPCDSDPMFGRKYDRSRVKPTARLSNHPFDRLMRDAANCNSHRWNGLAGADSGQWAFSKDPKQLKDWGDGCAQRLDTEIGRGPAVDLQKANPPQLLRHHRNK